MSEPKYVNLDTVTLLNSLATRWWKKFRRYLYSFWRKSRTWQMDRHCVPETAVLMHSIAWQKLLIGSKKVRATKIQPTSSITMPSLLGIVCYMLTVDKKVRLFLSCFRITKFVKMEMLLSSVTFQTIMVLLHRGKFLIVHLFSSFSMNPQDFPLGRNSYQILLIFMTFGL